LAEDEDVDSAILCLEDGFAEGDLALRACAFPCQALARVVDENMLHELGGGGEEMGPALPRDLATA
jgi:hypothetical protein